MAGLVSYYDYKYLGFELVDKKEFGRFRRLAEQLVERYTFGKVDKEAVTTAGKYAICEIIDIFYNDVRNGRLTGFTNEGYQESYRPKPSGEAREEALKLLYTFFERDFTYRGARRFKPGRSGYSPGYWE